MSVKEFEKLRLTRGTTLALQLGHRKSIDLNFLLQKFDLKKTLDFYNRKYFDGSEYLVLKSLTYFEDAEIDLDIETMENILQLKAI